MTIPSANDGPIQAKHPGRLPDDGPAVVADLALSGRAIEASSCIAPGDPARAWLIESAGSMESSSPELYRELVAAFPTTGLWPVRDLAPERMGPIGERSRHIVLYGPAPTSIRESFGLDRSTEYRIQEDDYCFECGPLRDRTGELDIRVDSPDSTLLEDLLNGAPGNAYFPGDVYWRGSETAQIALVPARRPAEAISNAGWLGGCNAFWGSGDAEIVLRSWEERFGAYLFSAGSSTLELIVTRPPRDSSESRLAARELLHFCPYDTQFHGFGGIAPYAASLIGRHRWSFWWD